MVRHFMQSSPCCLHPLLLQLGLRKFRMMTNITALLIFYLHADRDIWHWGAEERTTQAEARRTVFWELATLEGWMVLSAFHLMMSLLTLS